ncbi:hypothetical protein HK096_000836 [Nowakowskiella sp. JEL0078]|nr:hypothetical protein HK096_000836 [Nowakowskiella sp. JEL0078]
MPVNTHEEKEFHFVLPNLPQNSDGWGPKYDADENSEVPYAPFSKSDRLGKIADWTVPQDFSSASGVLMPATARNRFRPTASGVDSYGSGTADRFTYTYAAEEEASFSVVDRAAGPPKLRTYGPNRSTRGARAGVQGPVGRGGRVGPQNNRGNYATGKKGAVSGGKWGYNDKPQRLRDASIQVQPEWTMVEEIEFSRLSKLNFDAGEATDLAFHGSLNYFNKDFDKVSVKHDKSLQQIEKSFFNGTTSDDPILEKLGKASENEGTSVFITSQILATMMCTSRSIYPWDVVITKEGDKIYVDKRPEAPFDFVTVNENAAEPPIEGTEKESINSPGMLAQEATYINRNFSQQVLKESENCEFDNLNPFYDQSQDPFPPAPALYRYRQYSLGDEITLFVRTQLDTAVNQIKGAANLKTDRSSIVESLENSTHALGDTLFATVRALNEFDPRAVGAGGAPEWRQKLDAQRGAVMASEMKNNSNKLAKWAVESILAGADQIRIGFVSRVSPKDRTRHSILGVGFYKPLDFAAQMNYNIRNGWGIFKTLIDICNDMEDGKFVLVRDPNKPVIRLYQVPSNTFEDEFGEDL